MSDRDRERAEDKVMEVMAARCEHIDGPASAAVCVQCWRDALLAFAKEACPWCEVGEQQARELNDENRRLRAALEKAWSFITDDISYPDNLKHYDGLEELIRTALAEGRPRSDGGMVSELRRQIPHQLAHFAIGVALGCAARDVPEVTVFGMCVVLGREHMQGQSRRWKPDPLVDMTFYGLGLSVGMGLSRLWN